MRRYYWLAADQGQGRLAIDAIAGFVARTPRLRGQVEVQTWRAVRRDTGASLEVLPADAAGAWGLRPAGVFVDELAQWADTPQPRRIWEAVSSAVAKQPAGAGGPGDTSGRDVLAALLIEDGRRWVDAAADFQLADALAVLEGDRPYNFLTRARGGSKTTDLAAVALALLLADEDAFTRLVVLTTAGDPVHFAAKVLEHAKGSPLWRVNEVPGPAPWMDADRVAEQRARLPQAVFEQLFLNRWVAADGAFLDPALIGAAFTLDGPAVDRRDGRSYVAGLDLGHVNDRSVFALGHREGAETHLDRMMVWQGARGRPVDFGEVERFVVAAHERFRFRLRIDPWQALDLAQRLRSQGVRTDEFHFSTASKQRLASALLEGINGGALRLYEAEGLREELVGLRVKQTAGGAWTFDHVAGGHDDRAVGLALMVVAALEQETGSWRPVFAQDEAPKLRRQGFLLLPDGRIRPLPPEEATRARQEAEQTGQVEDPYAVYEDPGNWFSLP